MAALPGGASERSERAIPRAGRQVSTDRVVDGPGDWRAYGCRRMKQQVGATTGRELPRARGVAHAFPTKTRAPGCTQLHGPLDTAARARRRPGGRTASGMGIGFLGKGVKQKVIPLHLPPMSPTPTSAVAFCPVPIGSGQYAPVAGRAWVGTTLT